MKYYAILFMFALASCHSAKKMEESTDVVSVADVRLEDSISTSVSLSFDELDIWICDDSVDSVSIPNNCRVKHMKMIGGCLKREIEQKTISSRKDSVDFEDKVYRSQVKSPP